MAHENEAIKLQVDESTCFDLEPEKMAALGYPGVKISLKEDDVPTLFPVVDAINP